MLENPHWWTTWSVRRSQLLLISLRRPETGSRPFTLTTEVRSFSLIPQVSTRQKQAGRVHGQCSGTHIKGSWCGLMAGWAYYLYRCRRTPYCRAAFKVNTPVILVINKIDTIKVQEEILTFIAAYKDVCDFAEIVPLSALKDKIQMCF